MWEDPVSAQGRWVIEWADEAKAVGLERNSFKLLSTIVASWPARQSLCVDPLATSV